MKLLIIGCLALAVVTAVPVQDEPEHEEVEIINQRSDVDPEKGTYDFEFQTSDGTSRQEHGFLKESEDGVKFQKVQGESKYTAPDGQVITLTYKAGRHGFIATGDHIHQPHPIILKLIAYLESLEKGNPVGDENEERGEVPVPPKPKTGITPPKRKPGRQQN